MTEEYEDAGLLPVENSLSEWTGAVFQDADGIIYIGAAGIAVRAIAPYIKSKTTDPAVVVLDAGACFCISLLSGHLGGANDLARETARFTGAVPVITTATDVNGRFAVDEFARKNELKLSDMKLAKEVTADLLDGKEIGFFSDFPVTGELPEGLVRNEKREHIIHITVKTGNRQETGTLFLIPRAVVIGIGCKRGTPKEAVEELADRVLEEAGVPWSAVAAVASIELKKDEAGLIRFAEDKKKPLYFLTAEELEQAQGGFQESEFVRGVTGVGNVCERAAVMACRAGGVQNELLTGKQAFHGVTAALGLIRNTIEFGGKEYGS